MSGTSRDQRWARYEQLAHKIVSDLMPFAQVTLDDHIDGKQSEDRRQIDVSARWRDGSETYLLVVQVKDLARRADVNVVGTFRSVIEDVQAQKGILICSGGFSKAAKVYARNLGISLFALHDAESRDWALELTIPILWNDLKPEVRPNFQILSIAKGKFHFDAVGPVLTQDGGQTRISVIDLFKELWNSGAVDRTVGEHSTATDGPWRILYWDSDGQELWGVVERISWHYSVTRRSWLGQYRPRECRGLIDSLDSDSFIPTYMSLADLPVRRDDTWVEIRDPERVVLGLRGVIFTAEEIEIEGGSINSMSIAEVDRSGRQIGQSTEWSASSGSSRP